MRNRLGITGLVAIIALLFTSVTVHAQGREEARLLTASQVLNDALGSPDQFVPSRLLERAYGIAVVPDVTKVAFFFGGRRGSPGGPQGEGQGADHRLGDARGLGGRPRVAKGILQREG